MVVPMENIKASATSKCKKYIGNGLVIRLAENNSTVHVVGNDCRIKIDANDGALKVVGNSCHVQVRAGNGEIDYNGNEGRIRLGARVDEKVVTYVGNEGKITKEAPRDGSRSGKTRTKTKKKIEEVPVEKTRRSGGYTLDVVSKSHKRFTLSDSVFSITVPSVIAVPHVTDSVIKIRRARKS